jgi:hypothetical protein
MKFVERLLKLLLGTLFLLATVGLVSLIVVFLGREMFGKGMPGSDNVNFVTLASWVARWFPRIPYWYPQQGAGMSFTVSYPLLTHLIIAFWSRVFSVEVVNAFKILMLASMVLTSVGIYLLVVRFSRNYLAAFIAAILYPISPIAWVWPLEWGFSAEHMSHFLFAPAVLFFDLFYVEYLEGKNNVMTRIYLVIFLLMTFLLIMAHPSSFVGLFTLIAGFVVIYPIFIAKNIKAMFKRSIGIFIKVFLILTMLTLFWAVPYLRYQKDVKEGSSKGPGIDSREIFMLNAIRPANFFGITTELMGSEDGPVESLSPYAWKDILFPIVVSIFALGGFIGSLFLNRRLFSYGLALVITLALALMPEFSYLLRSIPMGRMFASWRAMIVPARIFLPVLAGFGLYSVAYLISFPFRKLKDVIKLLPVKLFFGSIQVVVATAVILFVGVYGLYYFRSWPKLSENYLIYGVETYLKIRMTNLRDLWGKRGDNCYLAVEGLANLGDLTNGMCKNMLLGRYFLPVQLASNCLALTREYEVLPGELGDLCSTNPKEKNIIAVYRACKDGNYNYPQICEARVESLKEQLSPAKWNEHIFSNMFPSRDIIGVEREFFDYVPEDPNTRLDVGISLGGMLMAAPYYTNTPELGVYFNTASLHSLFWNYEIASYYDVDASWTKPEVVSELAKYYGIEYVFLTEGTTAMERFKEDDWEKILEKKDMLRGLSLLRFKNPTKLLTVTTRPVVLVIGQGEVNAYFRIFHLANIGGPFFEEAIFVNGGSDVGKYSVEDLLQFDAVVMEGYRYKNRAKAWTNLGKYIEEGGSLFVNTGWQYTSADWQLDETPDFYPISQLEWTTPESVSDYKIEDSQLLSDVVVDEIAPLVFEDRKWQVSSASREHIRPWAKTVFSISDLPLVAVGNYGKGKVVWSGFDFAGHSAAYEDNSEELKIFGNLMKYMLSDKPDSIDLRANLLRTHPDKAVFEIIDGSNQKTVIYWKESYQRDFKAKVAGGRRIKTYRGGTDMTAMILPEVKPGTRIIYQHRTPLSQQVARVISVLTILGLIVYIVKPGYISAVTGKFSIKEATKKASKTFMGEEKDEDYNY